RGCVVLRPSVLRGPGSRGSLRHEPRPSFQPSEYSSGVAPDDELETWLDADGTSPLQVIWKRRDALATNELFTLGHAFCHLVPFSKWLAAPVRLTKGKDQNTCPYIDISCIWDILI